MDITKETTWLLKEKYNGKKCEAFFADCERLAKGEPLAYVIGHTPFLGTTIWLDSHPLIPRPETEFWVEKVIGALTKTTTTARLPLHILDLCAGSGAIGIAIAKALSDVYVDFAEIDPAHTFTIKKNILVNLGSMDDRCCAIEDLPYKADHYQVFTSDLFAALPTDMRYEFIVCNPPYIDKMAHTVEESVVEYEPHQALFGGKNGLEIIVRIIEEAKTKLATTGQLWLEHEPFQTEAIAQWAIQYGYSVTTFPDQYNTLRYSVLMLK